MWKMFPISVGRVVSGIYMFSRCLAFVLRKYLLYVLNIKSSMYHSVM